MIRLLGTIIADQIGKGSGRVVLIVMLIGAISGIAWVLLRLRDGDGHIVWGWVIAGGIGGAVLGATVGAVLIQQRE